MNKIQTLAQYLDCEIDEIHEQNECTYTFHSEEYIVYTDDEADSACREYIQQSLWSFRPEFIAHYTKASEFNCYDGLVESIRCVQEKMCESCNGMIAAMIDDIDDFISDAISADGRGHFLSSYDGHENEEGDYYIYRR